MPELLWPLIYLVGALCALGLGLLQRPVSGGFVKWAANLLGNIPIIGGILSVDQILKLDRWVTHELGKAFKPLEQGTIKWVLALARYQEIVGYWSLYWPIALVHEVKHLTSRTIPRAIDARTAPLARRIDTAEAEAKSAAGKAHSVTKYVTTQPGTKVITKVERVAMPHAREWDWLNKHWKALTAAVLGAAALPGVIDIPHVPSLPVPFGRTVKQLRRRLGRVEALLGVTAFAAVLASVLGVTAKCVRPGGPIGRTARALCGAPVHLLEDFLSLLADIWVLDNICVLIPLLEEAASVVAIPLVDALTTVSAGLCKGSIGKPEPLVGVMPTTPPLYTGQLQIAA